MTLNYNNMQTKTIKWSDIQQLHKYLMFGISVKQ